MCNPKKEILYLSRLYHGRVHDYEIFKEEFPKNTNWFINKTIRLDLGFIGIETDYKSRDIVIPSKNYKKKPLSEEQINSNKTKSSLRIKVEHAIGGIKRFRVLDNRLRHHDFSFYDSIIETCSALWNFYIKS